MRHLEELLPWCGRFSPTWRHLRAGFALAVCFTCASVMAQDDDSSPPGIPVGDQAPQIELIDQSGNQWVLADQLPRQKFVAVVFHRSADW